MPSRLDHCFVARQYLWQIFPSQDILGRNFFAVASVSLVLWQFATGILLSPCFLSLDHAHGAVLQFLQATHRWGAILLVVFAFGHLAIRIHERPRESGQQVEWLSMMLIGTTILLAFLSGSLLIPRHEANLQTVLALLEKFPYFGRLACDFLQVKTSLSFSKNVFYVAHALMLPLAILFLLGFRCILALYFLQGESHGRTESRSQGTSSR